MSIVATGIDASKGSADSARKALDQAFKKIHGAEPGVIFLHASSRYDYDQVLKAASEASGSAPLVGCSTAGLFTENRVEPSGVGVGIISSRNMVFQTAMASGLRTDPEGVVRKLARSIPPVAPGRHLTAILFADGLSGAGEELALYASRIFEKYAGVPVTLLGGFAGDDMQFRETRVFHGSSHSTDSVAVCFITSEKPFHSGVRHGHTPMSGAHTVTSANGNRVIEVDGRPAWQVWRAETDYAIEQLRSRYPSSGEENLAKLVMGNFELGLTTEDGGYKIRFPMAVNPDGSMMFTCSIPPGSVFRIMDGSDTDAQIEASRLAAVAALESAGEKQDDSFAGMLVFECGIRMALLDRNFSRAIEAYRHTVPGVPVLGWETYGEIRMTPGSYSGFHNTTTVVALVPGD